MRGSVFKNTVLWMCAAAFVAVVVLDVFLIISPSWALKSASSLCFLAGGIFGFVYALKRGAKKSFISLMLAALAFSVAGDITNYISGDLYFIIGAAFFAAAHVFYIAAYYCLYGFRPADVLAALCIFAPAVLLITLAPVFDFGSVTMEVVCAVYSFILALMVGKALCGLRERTAISVVIAVGSVLFLISDLSLLINMFGTDIAAPRIVCLATYYPAQILLAFSVFMSGDRGVNVFKAAYCRIFQFVLKAALPLLPYKDPKIIDAVSEIPSVLAREGKHAPLIVTDKTVRALGLTSGLENGLKAAGIEYSVYDEVVANPTTDNVYAALDLYKKDKCDCIIAVGGGSPMDCAKGVGALVARPNKTLGALKGILKVGKKIPLLIAVPTTAGTGSETTLAAVIVDSATRHKYAINDFPLIPSYAVLDGGITESLPPHIVASTGMDALTHAVEAYIGRGGNKHTRSDAVDAVKLIFDNIENAFGGDTTARGNMLTAAHKAGRAFSKAYVGYVHALAHALGGKYNTPHGLANAVLLPVVLDEYGSSAYKSLSRLAVACGLVGADAGNEQGAKAFIGKVRELNVKLGIPDALSEINEGDIAELSRYAEHEANPLYPVPALWDKNRLARIYRKITGEKKETVTPEQIVNKQKRFFDTGKTLDVNYRLEKLNALYSAITDNLDVLHAALKSDLGKSADESYTCETGLALSELSFMIKHVKKLSRPQRVRTPMVHFKSTCYKLPSPYGVSLVMSPWNYPFLLAVDPLIDSVAAGNTVVLKVSASAPETGKAIKSVIERVFPPEHVAVLLGGGAVNDELMHCKFDYIFFTGSKRVGTMIYRNAAETLTPVTLELGGKSPCVVDETANIPLAAKRIVWGKFLNLGQTCVAPDYVLCAESVHDRFIAEVKKQIALQFPNALENRDYGKMINLRHFDRVRGLIDASKTVVGGGCDETALKIEPTVLDGVTGSDAVMQEEIFGPILPVMTYKTEREATEYISAHDEPLAFYLFSSDKKRIKRLTRGMRFGGGCVNDVVVHLATAHMPFGGFGASGMGAYHGKAGFDTFTHYKSILDKATALDLPLRYQPYKKSNAAVIKKFLR